MKRAINFILRYFFALISCIYLFTIGFLKKTNRVLIEKICVHFGFIQKPEQSAMPNVPKISLSEITPDNLPIKIIEPVGVEGNVTLLEILAINRLIVNNKPQRIFEIGTFDGRTTINMAVNSLPDSKIYTLDLPKDKMELTKLSLVPGDQIYINKDISGSRYVNKPEASRITQLYGDSAAFDFSPYFNTMDFVFIDGSHSYDYIQNDSRIALKLLKAEKGVILWHDYGSWEGVTRALNELFLRDNNFKSIRQIEGTSLVLLIK
jgi:predicted O-methyltransferase YrrM